MLKAQSVTQVRPKKGLLVHVRCMYIQCFWHHVRFWHLVWRLLGCLQNLQTSQQTRQTLMCTDSAQKLCLHHCNKQFLTKHPELWDQDTITYHLKETPKQRSIGVPINRNQTLKKKKNTQVCSCIMPVMTCRICCNFFFYCYCTTPWTRCRALICPLLSCVW